MADLPPDFPRLRAIHGEQQPVQPENPVLQGLENDARVERMPMRLAAEAGPEALDHALANIRGFIEHSGMTLTNFAKQVQVSNSTISELIHGKYKGNVSALVTRCESVIDQINRRKGAPGAARFVKTKMARRIFACVKQTVKVCGMAALYGPSGLGKTITLEALVAQGGELDNGLLIKANPAVAAPRNLCRELVRLLFQGRIDPGSVRSKAEGFAFAVEKLKGSFRPIIIDEADCLTIDSLNVLRHLHDATGCPVILVGRPNLARRIMRTTRDEEIGGSLRGRLSIEQNLVDGNLGSGGGDGDGAWLFSTEEVMTVLKNMKIRVTPGAGKWLCALANLSLISDGAEGGGLRYAVKVAQLAVIAFSSSDEPLSLDQIKQASRVARDAATSTVLIHQVDEFVERHAIAAAG